MSSLDVLNLQNNRYERSLNLLKNLRELNFKGNRFDVLVGHLLDNNANLEGFNILYWEVVNIV